MTQRQNRLSQETSPYLLQHADNPVDWYPWGEEALSKAKEENKPILLSIGYSACHWCHVMAHESFENPNTADLMNEHFINIKVDREERPDLDQIYQTAVQFFIQRAGGWPLTMFLRPDQVPFHGGTYFPPEDRHRLPGFPSLLVALAKAYQERPEEIDATSKALSQALARLRAQKRGEPSLSEDLPKDLLKHAVHGLTEVYDRDHGGFGQAPKFPGTPSLTLLLHHFDRTGDQASLKMACYTLQQMAWGGMRDQLGGGFHRYSVDAAWQIPHFEKMLYDNAQLAPLYFSAFQASGDAFFKQVGMEVLDDVLRDMCDAQGGFYAAMDADSEGGEGAFYAWSLDQVTAELGPDRAKRFCAYYDMTQEGNFEGLNIPHRRENITTLATSHQMTETAFWDDIQFSRKHMREARDRRAKPFRDEKIITAWNAQMISAFVAGYQVTRVSRYLDAAVKAMHFVDQALYDGAQLLRVFKNGQGKLAAYLDDHSALLIALLDLYEATGRRDYLQKATTVAEVLVADFWDEVEGGFYYTGDGQEKLIERTKPCYDQSIPSGNATAALAFIRLSRLTGQVELHQKAERTLRLFAKEMKTQAQAMSAMIGAAVCFEASPQEIHVVADLEAAETKALLEKLHVLFLPHKIVLLSTPTRAQNASVTEERFPIERVQIKGLPTVYLCQNQSCSAAMTDWLEISKALMRPKT